MVPRSLVYTAIKRTRVGFLVVFHTNNYRIFNTILIYTSRITKLYLKIILSFLQITGWLVKLDNLAFQIKLNFQSQESNVFYLRIVYEISEFIVFIKHQISIFLVLV